MLNLLPSQQKIGLKKEYSWRRLSVFLGEISAVLVISLCLLIPSYLLTQIRENEAKLNLDHSDELLNKAIAPKEMTAAINTAVQNANILKPFADSASVYKILKIFETKSSTIKITDLAFSDGAASNSVLSVHGTAADRESLTAFSDQLKKQPEFSGVVLPVSDFVKDSNIDFDLTINLK